MITVGRSGDSITVQVRAEGESKVQFDATLGVEVERGNVALVYGELHVALLAWLQALPVSFWAGQLRDLGFELSKTPQVAFMKQFVSGQFVSPTLSSSRGNIRVTIPEDAPTVDGALQRIAIHVPPDSALESDAATTCDFLVIREGGTLILRQATGQPIADRLKTEASRLRLSLLAVLSFHGVRDLRIEAGTFDPQL